MTQDSIRHIRESYPNCITESCRENRCSLRLDGFSRGSMAIIHGGRYQEENNFTDKLCDRILFCGEHGFIMTAVELKGGGDVHLSEAIDQIQNGLRVAMGILGNRPVAEWLPLLMYSGSMHPNETRLLRTKSVEFRGQRKNIIKRNCNTQLTALIPG